MIPCFRNSSCTEKSLERFYQNLNGDVVFGGCDYRWLFFFIKSMISLYWILITSIILFLKPWLKWNKIPYLMITFTRWVNVPSLFKVKIQSLGQCIAHSWPSQEDAMLKPPITYQLWEKFLVPRVAALVVFLYDRRFLLCSLLPL